MGVLNNIEHLREELNAYQALISFFAYSSSDSSKYKEISEKFLSLSGITYLGISDIAKENYKSVELLTCSKLIDITADFENGYALCSLGKNDNDVEELIFTLKDGDKNRYYVFHYYDY